MEIDVVPDNNKKSDNTSPEFTTVKNSNTDDGEDAYYTTENLPGCSSDKQKGVDSRLHTNSHSKKVMKHALRQQAKRRRKNTTIAAGNSAPLPRIIVKPLPPQPTEELSTTPVKTPTMREVLASIPGFSIKPRKRSNKKLSTAAQLEQTKEGCIDLETPDSILVNTNLRALLNKHTFSILPPLYQYKLVQLLPDVDRQGASQQPDVPTRLSTSGLNNEFFARACLEWRERLAEGEFTPENQQKLKSEAEKEKSRLDPWKLKHFEPIWGEKNQVPGETNNILLQNRTRPPLKTTIKLRPSSSVTSKHSKLAPTCTKRPPRTVGAVTRAITNSREENDHNPTPTVPIPVETTKSAIPDLIPIKVTTKHHAHVSIPRPEIVISQMQSNDSNESTSFHNDEVDPLQITESSMDSNETRSSEPVTESVSVPPNSELVNTTEVNETCEESESFRGRLTDMKVAEKRSRSISPDCNESLPKKLTLTPTDSSAEKIKLDEAVENIKVNEPELITEEKQQTETEDHISENETKNDIDPNDINKVIDTCDSSKDLKEVPEEVCSEIENIRKSEENIDEDDAVNESQANLQDENPAQDIQNIMEEQAAEEMNTSVELEVPESFSMLPNSLILQQESIVLNKNGNDESCSEESAEKLEAIVEECDLVLSQLDEQVSFDQNESTNAESEDDASERFLDAESYVLESGAIADINPTSKLQLCSQQNDETKTQDDEENEEDREEIHAALFGTGVPRGDDCWDVDSSTEKLLAEVPLHALDSVPVAMTVVDTEEAAGDVAVIPMEEELEVRLEEGSFPVPDDWPYGVKMDSDMVAAALGTTDSISVSENSTNVTGQFPEYSTNQVKLELEVTLTPEIVNTDSLVTSSVGGPTSNITSSAVSSVSKTTVATVIPPTTIVCLPSVVSTSSLIHPQSNQLSSTSCPSNFLNSTSLPRTAMVASSSAVPYLALSTSQPMRAVTAHTKSKSKSSSKDSQTSIGNGSNRNRNSSNKPPPGAVNLERSYQICQAVIQNSPNRDQLRCQLKPPPSLLAANNNNNNNNNISGSKSKSEGGRATQYGTVTSSRNSAGKPFTPPLPASANFTVIPSGNGVKQVSSGPGAKLGAGTRGTYHPHHHQQRQPSPGPVLVRHVFTSSQGIPVTMAVLPPPAQAAVSPEVSTGVRVGAL